MAVQCKRDYMIVLHDEGIHHHFKLSIKILQYWREYVKFNEYFEIVRSKGTFKFVT